MCSPSIDSNSTRDSDQFSDLHPAFSPEVGTPNNSQCAKFAKFDANRAWDKEKDKLLINLVLKYNKDWKKVAKALSNLYQTKFSSDFLRDRYKLLSSSNMNLLKYAHKPEKKVMEHDPEDWNQQAHQFVKKVPNGFKQKPHTQLVNQTRVNLLDSLMEETESSDHVHTQTSTPSNESFNYFYTRDQQIVQKTVEIPWISFDFDKEFGSQDQLFERITPCLYRS